MDQNKSKTAEQQRQSRSGRTIKPSKKAREQSLQTQELIASSDKYYDLDIDQMDVKTAFLYGLINQLIYVEMPKGTETNATRDMICKLRKALYGLKQSPRRWYKRLSSFFLEKLSLRQINADHSISITSAGLNGPIVSTFVDDIKIMAIKGSGLIEKVKAELGVPNGGHGPNQFLHRPQSRTRPGTKDNQAQSACVHRENPSQILPRSGQLVQHADERIYATLTQRQRKTSHQRRAREVPRHDWIIDIFDGGDKARHCFCHVSCKSLRKESKSHAH